MTDYKKTENIESDNTLAAILYRQRTFKTKVWLRISAYAYGNQVPQLYHHYAIHCFMLSIILKRKLVTLKRYTQFRISSTPYLYTIKFHNKFMLIITKQIVCASVSQFGHFFHFWTVTHHLSLTTMFTKTLFQDLRFLRKRRPADPTECCPTCFPTIILRWHTCKRSCIPSTWRHNKQNLIFTSATKT